MRSLPPGTLILVLEDEPFIRLDIEDMLRGAGLTAAGADSLSAARAVLAAGQSPRVAILDALLPEGDSFTLARELAAAGTAVVFVTGYAGGIPEDLAEFPVVEKPFTPEDLVPAISAILRKQRGEA